MKHGLAVSDPRMDNIKNAGIKNLADLSARRGYSIASVDGISMDIANAMKEELSAVQESMKEGQHIQLNYGNLFAIFMDFYLPFTV